MGEVLEYADIRPAKQCSTWAAALEPLAVPLGEAGHKVVADFSQGMLDQMQSAPLTKPACAPSFPNV